MMFVLRLPCSHRHAHMFVLGVCVAALLIAFFFMELYLGLAPCPLCIVDRVIIVAIAVVSAFACIRAWPSKWGLGLYRSCAGINVVFGALGIAVAARHIWLQQQSTGLFGGCAPEVDFLLETLSSMESFISIFNVAGNCSDITWTFLGLSIPAQTLLLFVFLTAVNLFLLFGTRAEASA